VRLWACRLLLSRRLLSPWIKGHLPTLSPNPSLAQRAREGGQQPHLVSSLRLAFYWRWICSDCRHADVGQWCRSRRDETKCGCSLPLSTPLGWKGGRGDRGGLHSVVSWPKRRNQMWTFTPPLLPAGEERGLGVWRGKNFPLVWKRGLGRNGTRRCGPQCHGQNRKMATFSHTLHSFSTALPPHYS